MTANTLEERVTWLENHAVIKQQDALASKAVDVDRLAEVTAKSVINDAYDNIPFKREINGRKETVVEIFDMDKAKTIIRAALIEAIGGEK